jgi:serine/threonine protein kinase
MVTAHLGQQFGNYRLLRLLGEGGFAQVYLAEHMLLGTQAAVKILTAKLGADETEHFRNEARLSISMDHPHIVRVLEFGMQDSIPFLVMAYAPYGSLRALHPRGSQLPLSLVVSYIQQIASALQYIHDQKLIHRDVKPENMLVCQHGAIALSDFGIAVIAHSERSMSQQDIGGTGTYMAPEQFQGKPRPASDQYALGIIAYEWLCGFPPFQGNLMQLAYQHSYASPQPLSEKRAVAPHVEAILFKALAKDPRQRFERVQDFAQAFAQASQTDFSHITNGVGQTPPTSELLLFPSRSTKLSSVRMSPSPNGSLSPAQEQALVQQPSAVIRSQSSFPTAPAQNRNDAPPGQMPSPILTTPQRSLPQPPLPSMQLFSPAPAESRPSAPLPRVPLLAYPQQKRRRVKPRLGVLMLFLVVGVVLAGCAGMMLSLGYAAMNRFSNPGSSGNDGGSVSTATDFLNALTSQNYSQAYNDLDASMTVAITLSDFSQQAQHDDRCYGPVTAYTKPTNSGNAQGGQQLTSQLRRKKLSKPYTLRLTLMMDSATGQWLITSFGPDLGPAPPTCP